jgi:hypothetical protein
MGLIFLISSIHNIYNPKVLIFWPKAGEIGGNYARIKVCQDAGKVPVEFENRLKYNLLPQLISLS